jgi:hypothetical protein
LWDVPGGDGTPDTLRVTTGATAQRLELLRNVTGDDGKAETLTVITGSTQPSDLNYCGT